MAAVGIVHQQWIIKSVSVVEKVLHQTRIMPANYAKKNACNADQIQIHVLLVIKTASYPYFLVQRALMLAIMEILLIKIQLVVLAIQIVIIALILLQNLAFLVTTEAT